MLDTWDFQIAQRYSFTCDQCASKLEGVIDIPGIFIRFALLAAFVYFLISTFKAIIDKDMALPFIATLLLLAFWALRDIFERR